MIFPFFATLIIFCIWLAYEIKKSNRKSEKAEEAFWDKEARANATRAKSLDDLHYIVIPEDVLNILKEFNNLYPKSVEIPDHRIKDVQDAYSHLSECKIVNFSNISNTDLKLMYGAANLPTLTLYDQNFILMIRTLQTAAEYFREHSENTKAKQLLEFAIASGSDSMNTYKLLSEIYKEENDSSKINYLISSASLLNSITKGPIVSYLQEQAPADSTDEESILDILD